MSARGARSRKAVAKDIEKKEKKAAEKKPTDTSTRPHDVFADWPPPPSHSSKENSLPGRTFTLSSNGSQATSRSGSSNPALTKSRLNTIHSNDSFEFKIRRPESRSTSISGGSSQGKEKKTYQAKGGKETKAPRGRGGGVPVKRPTAPSPAPPVFRTESSAARVHPTQKTWIDFKIWESGDSLPPYGGWNYDEHMQTGDVLVYFKEEQQSEERPVPQIRCDLHVLENSGSTWLSNALMYGRIEDDDDDDWARGGSPQSSLSPRRFPQPPNQRRMLAPSSPDGMSPPPFHIDQAYFGVPPNRSDSRAQYYSDRDPSDWAQSPNSFQQPKEITPTHELWFAAPANIRTPQEQRLHHVAIRNYLAMLHGKPIVGADLYEMLTTLQPEIQVMYDLDHDNHSRSSRERSVQMIINYLTKRGLDDVRNSIKTALALLAWSEQENVKWRQGYLESFVHLAGVMSPQMEELSDFKRLSIVTRRNLAIAAKSLQLRIMEAEEKLCAFDFSDLWGEDVVNTKGIGTPVHQSYTSFRHFLIDHYTRTYGNWPPTPSKTWLNRRLVLALQKDFGALYDYLVDRDVVWDSAEERPGRKWQMANPRNPDFRADSEEHLGLTDLLVTFDNRHGYLHIPHPYPLLPKEVAGMMGGGSKVPEKKKGLFGGLRKTKAEKGGASGEEVKAQLQLSIVFGDATNVEKTDVEFNGIPLIDAFERYELTSSTPSSSSSSSSPPPPSPRDARLGRWLLLYPILQVLSTLSVDVRDLKFTHGVQYFLCTDLKRCPEWVFGSQERMESLEASQLRSWCWQRPWAPSVIEGEPVELEGEGVRVALGQGQGRREQLGARGERGGVEEWDEDLRRIGRKIERMQVSSLASSLPLGPGGKMDSSFLYSQAANGNGGAGNGGQGFDRRVYDEKMKREDKDRDRDLNFDVSAKRSRERLADAVAAKAAMGVGMGMGMGMGMDGTFRLTQSDYERRDWDGDVEPPIVPLRSPYRSPVGSPRELPKGFAGQRREVYSRQGGLEKGTGYEKGTATRTGWYEERTGWV